MTKANPYLWPKGATLIVRDQHGEICRSNQRRFDLADAIMLWSQTHQKTVTLSVCLADEARDIGQPEFERLIRYDLGFDGYGVTITPQEPQDLDVSYEWKLRIRPVELSEPTPP